MLERMVRFLTTTDVVLRECNNCLPNNKWLGVKHVLIVFGQTYVNSALLMISLTSNNTVCSSSKLLQKKKQAISKKGGGCATPVPRPEFISADEEHCLKNEILN